MKQPDIRLNWFFNLISKTISYMAPLIVTPYVSRIFGADGIGINSYTTANVTYFTLFCMLGISGYGRRMIAIHRNDKEETSRLFWELTVLHGVTSLVVFILYIFLIVCSAKYRAYYIVNIITILASVIDFNWFFEAYECFKFISLRNCGMKILLIILTFGLIHTEEDLLLYIGLNALSIFIANFSILFKLKKYVNFVPVKSIHWVRHLKEVLIYFIPTIAASIYSILDKSVINWITGSESENGYYEQAYKILMVINTFVHSLETVSAPRMSNLFANGTKEEFNTRLNDSLKVMLVIAMPCAMGVAAVAPTLVPVFFGAGYEKVISILYIFMPLVVVLGFSVYADGLYLVPSGQRGKSAVAVCVGAGLNLVLNIVLVIKWQSVGAAVATLVTEMVVSSIMLCMSRRVIRWKEILISIMKYGLAAGIMFAVVRGIGIIPFTGVVSLALQIVSGACVYMILLIIWHDEFAGKIICALKRQRRG